jgi:hypothetical protein
LKSAASDDIRAVFVMLSAPSSAQNYLQNAAEDGG